MVYLWYNTCYLFNINVYTMKKILLVIALLILSLIATGQKDTPKMSNYEKYLLQKEAQVKPDTIFKDDTVFVGQEKPEYDDLYYIPSKDELNRKAKDIRLEKKKIRIQQDSLYYDAKQEVYNDLFYTSTIYRFHRPYYFPYYSYYWNPFYNPWFLDSWYWNYPYYGFGYNNWYFDWNWGWSYPYHNNYYYRYNYRNLQSRHFNNRQDIPYGRRERQSNYSTNLNRSQTSHRTDPITVNRTVQLDRRSGQALGIQNKGQRRVIPIIQNRTITQPERRVVIPESKDNINIRPSERPVYNQTKKDYTPTYQTPRMNTRPSYNNSNPNKTYNRTTPLQNRSSVSTPNRSTYSTPSRSPSNYSAPSRSSSNVSNLNRGSSGGERTSSGSSSSNRRR
jgi:hypothetical protein